MDQELFLISKYIIDCAADTIDCAADTIGWIHKTTKITSKLDRLIKDNLATTCTDSRNLRP